MDKERLSRYHRAFRYVRNIAQHHCEDYTAFCLRTDVLVEACEKAEKYDEKETPKKVIKAFGYKCPCCNKEYVGGIINYCDNCGQRLEY